MLKQTKTITATLAAASSFTTDIYTRFAPDEVIIKNIAWVDDGLQAAMYKIRSTVGGDDSILGCIIDSTPLTFQPISLRGKPLHGQQTFEILNMNDVLTAITGDISFTLEFIKH